MKLIKAHATNYRNIIDSNPVDIGQMTCLVGKNEAGKSAFLKALEALRSTNETFKQYGKNRELSTTPSWRLRRAPSERQCYCHVNGVGDEPRRHCRGREGAGEGRSQRQYPHDLQNLRPRGHDLGAAYCRREGSGKPRRALRAERRRKRGSSALPSQRRRPRKRCRPLPRVPPAKKDCSRRSSSFATIRLITGRSASCAPARQNSCTSRTTTA